MSSKTLTLPLILTLIVLIQHTNGESYQLGARVPGDQPLQMNKLSASGVGRYPGPNGTMDEMKIFAGRDGRKITYLEVKDSGDNCARAIPINGGPGSSFVVIHLTAPQGCRIEFDIVLHGL